MPRSSRPARRAPARGATASARIAHAPSGPAPASLPALRWAAPALALVGVPASDRRGFRRGLALGALAGLAANARPELALLGALVWMLEAWRPAEPPKAMAPATGARGGRAAALLAFAGVFVLA